MMKLGTALSLLRLVASQCRESLGEARLRERLMQNHSGLRLGKRVEIRAPERLHLGRDIIIESGVLLHCGGMAWCNNAGGIRVGDGSYIGPNAVLFGAGEITLGAKVLISPGVVIASHGHTFAQRDVPMDDQPTKFAPVVIEDNVWIGSNATILPGVTIGTGSIIGGGSTVTKNVPPYSIWVGAAARPLRDI